MANMEQMIHIVSIENKRGCIVLTHQEVTNTVQKFQRIVLGEVVFDKPFTDKSILMGTYKNAKKQAEAYETFRKPDGEVVVGNVFFCKENGEFLGSLNEEERDKLIFMMSGIYIENNYEWAKNGESQYFYKKTKPLKYGISSL